MRDNECIRRIKEDAQKRLQHPEVKFRRETKERLDNIDAKLNIMLDALIKILDKSKSSNWSGGPRP